MRIATSALALILGVAMTTAAFAGDAVTVDQLPDAVKTAVNNAAKDGKLGAIEKDTVDGKVVYVAHITVGDKDTTVSFDEAGKEVPAAAAAPADK